MENLTLAKNYRHSFYVVLFLNLGSPSLKKKISIIEDSPKYLHKRLWDPHIGASTDQTLDLCPSNSSFH